MNNSNENKIKSLKKYLEKTSGREKESVEYKIRKLQLKKPDNYYSTNTTTPKEIIEEIKENQILILSGILKLINLDPSLKANTLSKIQECRMKILLYNNILSEKFTNKTGEVEEVTGTIKLEIKKLEIDPSYEIKRIEASILNKNINTWPIHEKTIEFSVDDEPNIILTLTGSNRSIHGIIILPCDFFIKNNKKTVILDFNNFNSIETVISFDHRIILKRVPARLNCIMSFNHFMEKDSKSKSFYCNVCEQKINALEKSLVCKQCKVRTHIKCASSIYFYCKNTRIASKKRNSNYTIQHTLKKTRTFIGIHCSHCGNEFRFLSEAYWCSKCFLYFHISCEKYIFDSCEMTTVLRCRLSLFVSPILSNKIYQNESINNYELIRVIGRGGFSKVILAKKHYTNQKVAFKVIKKENLKTIFDISYIEAERKVLEQLSYNNHTFIANLRTLFQDKYYIYFGLEFLSGGDLLHHTKKQIFLENEVKFYAAELFLAIEFLHKKNIVHRDLKLDNICLTYDGHIKITDFGMCAMHIDNNSVTYTYCGTPDIIAPEILKYGGYGPCVDWWSYGVVIYELIHRKPPFISSNIKKLIYCIENNKIEYRTDISSEIKSFLSGLLERRVVKRLGYGPDGFNNIKNHSFFSDIDWEMAEGQHLKPPFEPGDDPKNFDDNLSKEPCILTPSATPKVFEKFCEALEIDKN